MERLSRTIPEIRADRTAARLKLQSRFQALGFSIFSTTSRQQTFTRIKSSISTDPTWVQDALELIIDYVGLHPTPLKIGDFLDSESLDIFNLAIRRLQNEAVTTRKGLFEYGSSRHREAFEKILGSLTITDNPTRV